MSNLRKLLLGIGPVFILGVIVGSMLARAHTAQASSAACGDKGTLHHITIENDRVSPEFTDGKVSDTIQITNQDFVTRKIAFGFHVGHAAYDGVTEKLHTQHQSFKLTLNQTGQFHFHAHNHNEAMGYYNAAE